MATKEELLALLLLEESVEAETEASTQARHIPRREPAPESPLSYSQERLWFLDRLEPNTAVYNIPLALSFTGALDLGALQRAVDGLVARHDALRTKFSDRDGDPIALVSDHLSVPIEVMDLSAADGVESAALFEQHVRRPFDLSEGPLIRATLFRTGQEHHTLLLVLHHIVSDWWSLRVVAAELSALYKHFASGEPLALPELPIRYSDYAYWQRETLRDVLEEQLQFWRKQLSGNVAPIELPLDRPRHPVQTYAGAQCWKLLPASLTDALRELGRTEKGTLFTTLLAAFGALLFRYTGQDDLRIGSPVAGRHSEQTEGLIGLFVNTLVMRTNLQGNPTFRELLQRVRETVFAAYGNQDVPFERIVEALQPVRDRSRSPLFQVLFNLQTGALTTSELNNLDIQVAGLATQTAKFELNVEMLERPDGLSCVFEYNTDLFDKETIERMLGHYERLLFAVVANPDLRLSELPLLTPQEERQLIAWNSTGRDYPLEKTVAELFEEQVERTPDAVALVIGLDQLTYREFRDRVNQLAHKLRELGVGPEKLVGVCMTRSTHMVVALHAVMRAGGAYVPLDPDLPAERLRVMMQDAAPAAILTQEQHTQALPQPECPVICVDTQWNHISTYPRSTPGKLVSPSSLAYVIYTSGSTGTPKGAMNTHRALTNRLWWMQEEYQLQPSDVVLQKTPYSFDVSVWEFFWPFFTGATLVVAAPDAHKDPRSLAQLIRKHGVTTLHFVPSMLAAFLDSADVEKLTSLRRVICSGEALSYELQQRFFAVSNAELHNLYGPTEAAIDVTYWPCDKTNRQAIVPIGWPIANTEIHILDAFGNQLPVGLHGELHIGGVNVGRGYLYRPELTAEKFIHDPFRADPDAKLYKTGDLARRRADGSLEYLGRLDFQVKIRGLRIELGEIESLLRQQPGVREAVVVAWGADQSDKRLVAYLDCAAPVDHNVLADALKQRLPEYMVPSLFVNVERMPLTSSGKVDRKSLPALELATVTKKSQEYVAPATPLEKQLTEIWSAVLNVERVGIHDNFFELGGHSLLAVRLFTRIEKATGHNLPLATLFQSPTVKQLADTIEVGQWKQGWSTVVELASGGSTPFFCVHSLGANLVSYKKLAMQLGGDHQFYGLQPHGLDGNQKPFDDLPDMAAAYIEEIRRVQPQGPYRLGGVCLGGVVAFEMAQQLKAAGEEIDLLLLIDSDAPGTTKYLHTRPYLLMLADWHLGELLRRTLPAQLEYVGGKLRTAALAIKGLLTGNKAEGSLERSSRKVQDANLRALLNYQPQEYDGRIVLFWCSETPTRCYEDRRLAWSDVAQRGLELHVIPGNHMSMIEHPHVNVMAATLRDCLGALPRTSAAPKTKVAFA